MIMDQPACGDAPTTCTVGGMDQASPRPGTPPDAPGRLMGRVAIVTGASTGIGAAVARLFVELGASVVAMARREDRLARMAADLPGDRVTLVPGDVGREADVERLVAATMERHGRLDIVVSNAGIHRTTPFLDTGLDEWRELMATNLDGTFLTCRAAARAMVAGGRPGSMVIVASTNSLVAEPSMAAYNASKAAIASLAASMALELAPHDIRVNAVAPGTIETEITRPMIAAGHPFGGIPMGRIGDAREVAWAVAFLAGDEASYVTGTTLVVDGGQLAINGEPLPRIAPFGPREAPPRP
jgi:NAD(P)-dependent dehydrogenase (short-subunit alcohol dehydrogenase family)